MMVMASAGPVEAKYELAGDLDEGLKSLPPRHAIPRRGTCTIIITCCSLFGFQLLKGPPRSGKTSLLQLLEKLVNTGPGDRLQEGDLCLIGEPG